MRRPRSLLAAAALVLLLAGCGAQSASQESVRNAVREGLLERENPVDREVASEIADCVARGLFEGDFTAEERDEITQAPDGDSPPEELTNRLQALLDDCEADAAAAAGDAGAEAEADEE